MSGQGFVFGLVVAVFSVSGACSHGADGVAGDDQGVAPAVFRLTCGDPPEAHCIELGHDMVATQGTMQADTAAMIANILRGKCEGGDVATCEGLGELYLNGKGLRRDEGKAFSIFELACGKGNARACLDTGVLFATGTGTSIDLVAAKRFIDQACAGGEPIACADAKTIAPYVR